MNRTRAVTAAVALLAASAPAVAHDLWLIPPATASVGTPVTVRAVSGSDFPTGDHAPDPAKFARRVVVRPDGSRADLPAAGADGADGLLRFTPGAHGVYVVAVETTPKFIELTAAAFNEYLVSDGLAEIYRLRAKEGTLDRPARERYSKSPKALLRVGDGGGGDTTRPVGLPLEIVPLADPFAARPGAALRVRVLFRGAPLSGANLGWDHPDGGHPAGTVRTDGDGVALVPVARPGPMTVRLTHMTRPNAADHEWESFWTTLTFAVPAAPDAGLPWVRVSPDKTGFVAGPAATPFAPWGVNYDRDAKGRLHEDYWEAEWDKVVRDVRASKRLGANVVRVHLQVGKFMTGPDAPNAAALNQLGKLVRLAEEVGVYLDLTGLCCYHKADVPAWYDALGEEARWDAQAKFWTAVAGRCKDSPAVFCYDLMNEPVVPAGKRKDGDWLGPAFAGKHYVQVLTLDQKGRPRPEIARAWVKHLIAAVRKVDPKHLITVGLVDWSLERKGLQSGFVPQVAAGDLDFVAVHLYPEAGKLDAALDTLKGFAIGKPVVVEETFPLKCSPADLERFIDQAGPHAAGWVSFYWGTPPEELRGSKQIGDAITLDWLTRFEKRGERRKPEK